MLRLKREILIFIITFFIISSSISVMGLQKQNIKYVIKNSNETKTITIDFTFSNPTVKEFSDYVCVYVQEADFYSIADGVPVLPVKHFYKEFIFGTEIIDVTIEPSSAKTLQINKKISFGKISPRGTDADEEIYNSANIYPSDWATYHTGGGLASGQHKSFISIRIYPVRYDPLDYQIQYINQITITIEYKEPQQSILPENSIKDLLIISPSQFSNLLQPLVDHKNDIGIKTILETTKNIYSTYQGRDEAEKIKYCIKNTIETKGIKYVLIVGGLKGQSYNWALPVRYSHVVPPDEQEYAEERYISDLYFADIYDSKGDFSSWDTNNNDVFSEFTENKKDEMDLYPDIYFGRLACRSIIEVSTVVNKIINYESGKCDEQWFKKLLLVSGDAYDDFEGFNEGELISEEAILRMSDFTSVKLYATKNQDITKDTVKELLDPGCGFAYFCGHGSPLSWSTHFPPDGKEWATGFDTFDIIYLNNKEKLPIVVVGGCHNAQFDVTILNLFRRILDNTLQYGIWAPRCWAWWLTCKIGGGSIATIADAGLGTHGREDTDKNGIADYLEVLDGWLELRFLELSGNEQNNILGENYAETLTGYLHTFLGSNEKMDVKMIQQWQLFGDPSLHIGGI